MNRIIGCVLLICVLGAIGCPKDPKPPTVELRVPPVPETVLANIPPKIGLLKPGMTEPEVLNTLGLTEYLNKGWVFAHGGGSLDHHWTSYQLREGCILILSFDRSGPDGSQNEKFLSATLSGNGWPENKPD